jgi:dihydrofolate reductase
MLCSSTFLTLDGVMSGPHVFHPTYASDESVAMLDEQAAAADAMLVGRRTYDEFAQYWPYQDDSVPLAARTNALPKFVATHRTDALEWGDATAVDDLGALAARLRDEGRLVMVPGSATVVQALLAAGLLDELRITLDPTLAGSGRRLFADGGPPVALALVERRALPNDVQYLVYRPTTPPAPVPVPGLTDG